MRAVAHARTNVPIGMYSHTATLLTSVLDVCYRHAVTAHVCVTMGFQEAHFGSLPTGTAYLLIYLYSDGFAEQKYQIEP